MAFHVTTWTLVVRLGVALMGVPALLEAIGIIVVAPLMIASFCIYMARPQLMGAVVVGSVITAGTLV